MPTHFFKGPTFYSPSNRARALNSPTALPVAHGNIDEEDFTNQKAGRPTRKSLEMQRKRKESKDESRNS